MNAYSIKIALRGVSPMIWRRLRVRGNTSLADLNHIIQIAMCWDDDHLHSFHIYGEDGSRYYKVDETFALFDLLAKVFKAKKTTTVGKLRPLIEHYEDVRFSRVLINKQAI